MKFTVRPIMQQALLLLVILVVYFPSVNNPFSRFDDPFIIEYFGINNNLSLLDVIKPGSSFYYRPIVSLSYWVDSILWDLEPTFMHLENIIVHLLNVLLVFHITSQLPITIKYKFLPFFSALLFGLHPINSESVNWIAGRTDVFAGFFVFLALYLFIRAIQEQSKKNVVLAFILAMFGMLTKETAIMFFPLSFLIACFWPNKIEAVTDYKVWRSRYIIRPTIFFACLATSLLFIVYIVRRGDNAISMIFDGGHNVLVRSFEALGFYSKKLFFPLPLNVAILEVEPAYMYLGIITVLMLIPLVRLNNIPGTFLLSAVLFILPALIVAVIPIAWTPYGERYLYIPSAFAVIGCLELSLRYIPKFGNANTFVSIISVICVLAAVATFKRGRLWGNNLLLLEDIVTKSPEFGVARNEYGALLIIEGRFSEAENQFRIGLNLKNQANVQRVIQNNLVGVRIHGKPLNEARMILLSEIGNKSLADSELLKLLYKCEEGILNGTNILENKLETAKSMIEINEILFSRTKEPHYLYKSGQLALSVGNKQAAAIFFRRSWENANSDSYFKEPARRLAEKLETK